MPDAGDVMKILFFLNPKGLMDRDLIYSFRKRGIEVFEEKLNFALSPEGHSVEMFSSERLMGILDTFKPDLVFSFNGNGVDNNGVISTEFEKRGIPYATWFVDRPRVADLARKYVRANSYMFVFDKVYIQTLKGTGFQYVYYLPLATNPDRFRPIDAIADENAVCFIGDLDYKTIQYLAKNIDAMAQGADDRFYRSVETAIQRQYAQAGRDTWDIIEEVLRESGFTADEFPQLFRDILEGFVEREASLRLRMEAVKAVSERFPTVVFGDALWGQIVGDGYKGRVNYFTDEIVEVYNRYAVHVNVSKFQLRWAVNQRPYDVSACGGFLITDDRQDLYELYEKDEMVSFEHPEDLVDHVLTFMYDEPRRKLYAEKARDKVLSAHTYQHRIDVILAKVCG